MTHSTSLLQLLTAPRESVSPVAVSADGSHIGWEDFLARCAAWYKTFANTPATCIALYSLDTLEFLAALLALWQQGKHALIPGDDLPATLERIQGSVDALAGDLPVDTNRPLLTASTLTADDTYQFREVSGDQLGLIIFTSGSTGEPKQIKVFLRQIAKEVALHESLWGEQLQAHPVLSTASHQHFYGMIFQALWPLTAGRPFARKKIHYFEELAGYAEHSEHFTLITTPSHLTRIPLNLPWEKIRGRAAAIFSSTAPLPRQASIDAQATLGTQITEIFGSSETGAIAWRHQCQSEDWQLLPELEAQREAETGAMRLRSPILPNSDWLQTSDRIEFTAPTRFRLLGRLDRIAKVEGKRLSLTAVENLLAKHPWVELAHIVLRQSRRTELLAVVLLSHTGRSALVAESKRFVTQALRQHLQQEFELPVIPRRWRYPEEIPANAVGKVTQQTLLTLFSMPEEETQT